MKSFVACVVLCASAEVEDIRPAYEKRHPGVALGQIHDKMLSFGSPPPKYVRELMGL